MDVSLKMEVLYLLGESVKGKQQVENLATYIICNLEKILILHSIKIQLHVFNPNRENLPTPQLKHGLMNGNLLARQNDFKRDF